MSELLNPASFEPPSEEVSDDLETSFAPLRPPDDQGGDDGEGEGEGRDS